MTKCRARRMNRWLMGFTFLAGAAGVIAQFAH